MKRYSKELYSKEVLMKTAFAFTDEMFIHLDAAKEEYLVELTSKKGVDAETLYAMFENELIAQETRRIVTEKTKHIREMIVARSLSSTIINTEPDEEADTDEYHVDEILTDWFEQNE